MKTYPTDYERVNSDVSRQKVPGGWIVWVETSGTSPFFYPDLGHEWKVKKLFRETRDEKENEDGEEKV